MANGASRLPRSHASNVGNTKSPGNPLHLVSTCIETMVF